LFWLDFVLEVDHDLALDYHDEFIRWATCFEYHLVSFIASQYKVVEELVALFLGKLFQSDLRWEALLLVFLGPELGSLAFEENHEQLVRDSEHFCVGFIRVDLLKLVTEEWVGLASASLFVKDAFNVTDVLFHSTHLVYAVFAVVPAVVT
jgi:hypothetical protein